MFLKLTVHVHISYSHFLSSPSCQYFWRKTNNPEDDVNLGSAVQPGPIHLSLGIQILMHPNVDHLYFNIHKIYLVIVIIALYVGTEDLKKDLGT